MQAFYFDTRDYTPDSTYDLIPNGTYTAMIVEAKEMVSKTTGTPYATLKVEIVEGKFKGRKIYDNIFLNSTNEMAQAIARRKLNAIANAVGITVMNGADDFLFKPLSVEINTDKEGKNQIRGYKSNKPTATPAFSAPKSAPLNDSVPF